MDEEAFRDLARWLHSELRSPLTSIVGYSGLLQTVDTLGPLNDTQRETIAIIEQLGRYCAFLLHDITIVMALRAGDRVPTQHAYDLNAAITLALMHERQHLDRASVTVRFDPSPAGGVIAADSDYLDVLVKQLVGDLQNVQSKVVYLQTRADVEGIWWDIQTDRDDAFSMWRWPMPLVAFIVQSIVAAHDGRILGDITKRNFSLCFPAWVGNADQCASHMQQSDG